MANDNSQYLINKKHGFTLVELSIVLVIIGLLISGILVGQSLIDSARTHNYMKKLIQIEIAFDLFVDKYKQLPGDSDLFTPNGNNNGELDASGCDGVYEYNEFFSASVHLSASGMINEQVLPYSPSACGGSDPDSDNPANWVANDYTLDLGYTSSEWAAWAGGSVPPIAFGAIGVFYPAPSENIFTALDVASAVSIDKKVDDGDGSSGSFLTGLSSDTSNCTDALSTPTADCLIEHKWKQ